MVALIVVALSVAYAPQPGMRGSVGLKLRPAPIALGSSVPDVPFAAAYKPAEIERLWRAVKQCYGGEASARAAVQQNDQILCPLYASPELLTQSKGALVRLMGREDALDVMLKNPMVLTCGAAELEKLSPDEIKSTANVRRVLDKVVTPTGLAVAVLVLGLLKAAGQGA